MQSAINERDEHKSEMLLNRSASESGPDVEDIDLGVMMSSSQQEQHVAASRMAFDAYKDESSNLIPVHLLSAALVDSLMLGARQLP